MDFQEESLDSPIRYTMDQLYPQKPDLIQVNAFLEALAAELSKDDQDE